ncbi:MAG: S-adenosyl-L-methionine-binding protein [Methanoregulaceae archaeon PtaU1.Bin066]|nr:MAG: S-adenosyl-L-methionine-binding protein [Methanoregulaceae archaeon PtaU1.Bin066]
MYTHAMTGRVIRDEMTLYAVGVIKNDLLVPPLLAGEDGLRQNHAYSSSGGTLNDSSRRVSLIVFFNRFIDLLDGIEEYSHLMVIYWGHKVPEAGRGLTMIHPAGREDFPVRGIFATCSPARPNPILVTVVTLLGRDKNTLSVLGLDAIDNSPVLDIKPYVPGMYPREGVRIPGWMEKIMTDLGGNCQHDNGAGPGLFTVNESELSYTGDLCDQSGNRGVKPLASLSCRMPITLWFFWGTAWCGSFPGGPMHTKKLLFGSPFSNPGRWTIP